MFRKKTSEPRNQRKEGMEGRNGRKEGRKEGRN